MGDWEQILFERRVLWWTTLLVLVDTGLWLVALATPYWVIHIAGSEEGHLDTDSDSQAFHRTMKQLNIATSINFRKARNIGRSRLNKIRIYKVSVLGYR